MEKKYSKKSLAVALAIGLLGASPLALADTGSSSAPAEPAPATEPAAPDAAAAPAAPAAAEEPKAEEAAPAPAAPATP